MFEFRFHEKKLREFRGGIWSLRLGIVHPQVRTSVADLELPALLEQISGYKQLSHCDHVFYLSLTSSACSHAGPPDMRLFCLAKRSPAARLCFCLFSILGNGKESQDK